MWVEEQLKSGPVDGPAVQARLREQGIVLVGGGAGGTGGAQAPAGRARCAPRDDPREAPPATARGGICGRRREFGRRKNEREENPTDDEPETPAQEVDEGEDEDEGVVSPSCNLNAFPETLIRIDPRCKRDDQSDDQAAKTHGEQKHSWSRPQEDCRDGTEHQREAPHYPADHRQHQRCRDEEREQQGASHEPLVTISPVRDKPYSGYQRGHQGRPPKNAAASWRAVGTGGESDC